MTTDDIIEALGCWEGYYIEKMDVHQEEGKAQVWIELGVTGVPLRCQLPCKVLEGLALGIQALGFLWDAVGLQR